jgi:bacterial leucyl aminopeptidase
MKSFSLVSVVFLAGAVASPQLVPFASDQFPLGLGEPVHVTSYDGFHLDLSAQRLVEMEGQEPVWMTELEKVLLFIDSCYQ